MFWITPGAFDFSGEVMEALRAADAAVIVCSAKDGISVGLEKAWKYCEERNMPRFVYISKTDEENSDYNATFEAPAGALRQEDRAGGGPHLG